MKNFKLKEIFGRFDEGEEKFRFHQPGKNF
jgi:hypothetical protein